jgi:hypothetical protein
MLGMKPAPILIEVTTPVALSPRYGEARPGTIVRVPEHRAALLLRSGCVKRLERVPDGRQAAEMLDDALFELPAPPPREKPLDRPAVLKMFNWSDEQLDRAGAVGFPAPDHVLLLNDRRIPEWLPESLRDWRARIVALNIR